jgi:DNA excision repair protein ERCC-4
MLTDQAGDIFENAKNRVYRVETRTIQSPNKKQKTLTQMASGRTDTVETVDELNMILEENPKWKILDEILDEVNHEIQTTKDPTINGKVLVITGDDKTSYQVQEYLRVGGRTMLLNLMQRLVSPQIRRENQSYQKSSEATPAPKKAAKKTVTKKRKSKTPVKKSSKETEVRLLNAELENGTKKKKMKQTLLAPLTPAQVIQTIAPQSQITHFEIFDQPMVDDQSVGDRMCQIIVTTANDSAMLLENHIPSFVVIFDHDLSFIRRLEVHKSLHPGRAFRVYIVMYSRESVEFKQYLASLSREQESFKQLIHIKSRLTIPSMENLISQIDQTERFRVNEIERDLIDEEEKKNSKKSASTRKAGGALAHTPSANRFVQSTVVVDMREFRCSLPSLLNLSGMRVVPVQLAVGDYIVTKELCVERKSTSDLWGSLISGRLFTQAESMLKYYKYAALLIEFDQRQPFSLMDPWEFAGEVSGSHIISKLALLTLHFPRLKIFWCRTPNATAKLFATLKNDAGEMAEPDVNVAQSIGTGENDEGDEASHQAVDFLKRLPGVNEFNIYKIMTRVATLYDLCQMSLSQLTNLIGEVNGKKLHDFLNESNGLVPQG